MFIISEWAGLKDAKLLQIFKLAMIGHPIRGFP
jgi:hypothetical protein